jgi:hypothetical protein
VPRLFTTSHGVFAEDGPALYSPLALSIDGYCARGRLQVQAGARQHLVVASARACTAAFTGIRRAPVRNHAGILDRVDGLLPV